MTFDMFSDDHLTAAERALGVRFEDNANGGNLSLARSYHVDLIEVRAELERRAVANLRKSEAA